MQFFDDLDDISNILKDDGVVIHPTDTIWGLACSSRSIVGIERMYKIKDRPKDQKFLLLVNSIEMLKEYVERLHPRIETLLMHHQKPLTLIHPRAINLPDILIADGGTVAVRYVMHEFTQSIIDKLGCPLVSTSANFRANPYPNIYEEIDPLLLDRVDYVARQERTNTKAGQPSVIAKYSENGELDFIRE